MAPDERGGLWLAVRGHNFCCGREFETHGAEVEFFHYTDVVPRPLFSDAPHPVRPGEQVTAMNAGADGRVWLATNTSAVYRYDRLTGWDRVAVKGWDPGRNVTVTSPAYAVAVGPDGRGVVVGARGRVADVSPAGAVLDAAAGLPCGAAVVAPCGTTQTLRAAAVAPDGSALVGGDNRALLWRPVGGDFQKIAPPPDTPLGMEITSISMPVPGRAWLATDDGRIIAGTLAAGQWSWQLEDVDGAGGLLAIDPTYYSQDHGNREDLQLRIAAVAIDSSGHGFAVGQRGLILERTGDSGHPWQRVFSDVTDNFYSVALPVGGHGDGALIGGDFGRVLTFVSGRFLVAREADRWSPLVQAADDTGAQNATPIKPVTIGVALVPGGQAGQIEAWAAYQQFGLTSNDRRPEATQILHYTSDAGDPLLNPQQRAKSLPDTPPARPGELSFAAFGDSACQPDPDAALTGHACPELHATSAFTDQEVARIVDAVATASRQPHGPSGALFTGDATDRPGTGALSGGAGSVDNSPLHPDLTHDAWVDYVADPFVRAGVPLYGAVGVHDLDAVHTCALIFQCADTGRVEKGSAIGSRRSLAGMAAPWGGGQVLNGPGGRRVCGRCRGGVLL